MRNWLTDGPLVYPGIVSLLPHRFPFLLVDRVDQILVPEDPTLIDQQVGRQAIGVKNVTVTEPFAQGHFPGNPVFPGVLIVEALAQVSAFVLLPTLISGPGLIHQVTPAKVLFAGIDGCRFRHPVVPGDQITLISKALKVKRNIWQFQAEAYLSGNKLAAEAQLMAMVDVGVVKS